MREFPTFTLGEHLTCPACGHPIPDATAATDPEAHPEPGKTLSVCAYCYSFMLWQADRTLRVLSLQEIAALTDSERIELQRTRRALERARAGDARGLHPVALMVAEILKPPRR